MKEKYEMLHRYEGGADFAIRLAALVAIATGLPLWNEDGEKGVWAQLPDRMRLGKGWYSRELPKLFTELGYNSSPDFKTRFDRDTPYPCLMRYVPTKRALVLERRRKRLETGDPKATVTGWWNILVYYDGLVYDPSYREPYPLERFSPLYKVTSMMQVWVAE
jgi:hypothetical protein